MKTFKNHENQTTAKKTEVLSKGQKRLSVLCAGLLVCASCTTVLPSAFATKSTMPNAMSAKSDTAYEDIYEGFSEEIEESVDEEVQNVSEAEPLSVDVPIIIKIDVSKWTDYTVTVNGTKVTLPIGYKEFSKTTGSLLADAETTLDADEYAYAAMSDSNGNTFNVKFLNESDSTKSLAECTVVGISTYKGDDDNANVAFFGGIKIGSDATEERLTEFLGEPDDAIYSVDGRYFKYFYYEDYETYGNARAFEITVYDGVISGLSTEKTA